MLLTAVARRSEPRDVREYDGRTFLIEKAIVKDIAFVKAYKADALGNCYFRGSARNFNSVMGRVAAPKTDANAEWDMSAMSNREMIVRRAALEFNPNGFANLAIGMPTLASGYLPVDFHVTLQIMNVSDEKIERKITMISLYLRHRATNQYRYSSLNDPFEQFNST
jgi:3-oxoacid CoA-transferase